MKYSVGVIASFFFTLNRMLLASKLECTEYYLIFEVEDLMPTSLITTNNIDWVALKNESQDAYDEIRGYGDCILDLNCLGTVSECFMLPKVTHHLGTHEFIPSTTNTTDTPLSYTTESVIFKTEPTTINNNLTTTTENDLISEFDIDVLEKYYKTCWRSEFDSIKECFKYYMNNNSHTNDTGVNSTTESNLKGDVFADIFYKSSNCSENATSNLVPCNDNELETTTLNIECEEVISDVSTEIAGVNTTIHETTNKQKDFNISIKYDPKKNIENKTNIDITNYCNESLSLNNKTNEYSIKCEKIDDSIYKIDNETTTVSPVTDKAVIRNATGTVQMKPEDFNVILVYHNKQCTYNGTEFDITNKCHKVTNLDDANSTFSLECQFVKEHCVYTHKEIDIDKRIRKDNQTAYNFNGTTEWNTLRLEKEKKGRKNTLITYLVASFLVAAGGLIGLAVIALKSIAAVPAGSFRIPDDPPYTHPEFRDDVEETLC